AYRTSSPPPSSRMPADVYAGGPRGVTARRSGLWVRLLRLVVPAPCLSCGTPVAGPTVPLGLCAGCRGRLCPLDPAGACALCPLARAGPCALRPGPSVARPPRAFRCAPCRDRPPAFDRLLARWRYEAPLDAVIAGLKFRRLDYLGRHLGLALAEAFAGDLAG